MDVSQIKQGANNSRVIVALDDLSHKDASRLATLLRDKVAGGKATDLIEAAGAPALDGMGWQIRFKDPKLHDIEQTVCNRIKRYAGHADILTIHACMPAKTLEVAAKNAHEARIICVGVTVLTGIDPNTCRTLLGDAPENKVVQLANHARRSGLDGIVCSPAEAALVRNIWPDALIITPGIRSPGAEVHDQQRVMTPTEAISNGADLIVCGREITNAKDPLAAASHINRQVNSVMNG